MPVEMQQAIIDKAIDEDRSFSSVIRRAISAYLETPIDKSKNKS